MGFEPTSRLRDYLISSAAPSTTRTTLRVYFCPVFFPEICSKIRWRENRRDGKKYSILRFSVLRNIKENQGDEIPSFCRNFECVALRPLFRFFVSEAVGFVVPKSRTVTGFFERHTPENGSVSGLLQNGFESRKNAILGRTEGRQDRTKTERQYTDSTPIILYF